MDNWCIVKGAEHPNAAHAWINYICDPEVSLKDLAYHGYNTGIVGSPRRGGDRRSRVPRPRVLLRRGGRHDGPRSRERGPRPSRRHLEQGEGRLGSLTPSGRWNRREWRRRGRERPRRRAPRFILAIPAWLLFIFFFAVPVLFIFWYSFGYKPDIYRTIATDQLSFDRYVESFSDMFRTVFSGTLQISVVGTILCLLIALPVRVLARGQGASHAGQGSCSASTIHPLLDQLLRADARVAGPAAAERSPFGDPAGRGSDWSHRSTCSTRGRPCSWAWSTTTCP